MPELGRMDPATEKPPPVDRDPWWWPDPANAASAPGGRANPDPSWRVTIRIPGFNGGGGGTALASEAAREISQWSVWRKQLFYLCHWDLLSPG